MSRFSAKLSAITLLVCGLAAAPASAHHSFAMFDLTKVIVVEGTVKEFAWTNPHVVLWVVANPKEGQPEQIWPVEFTSPGNLTRGGLTKHMFKAGDRVKVSLHPLRTGEPGGSFVRALMVDTGREVTLPRGVLGSPDNH